MKRIERLLTVITIAVVVLVLENLLMVFELHRTNQHLRSMNQGLQTIQEDLLHVKEDVEANADSLDTISNLLEQQAPQQN